jgi:hypothetical protein
MVIAVQNYLRANRQTLPIKSPSSPLMRLVYAYLYVLCARLNKLYFLRMPSTADLIFTQPTPSPRLTPPKGKFIPLRKYKYTNICINVYVEGIIFRQRILQRVLSSSRSNDRLNMDHLAYQKLHKMIDYRGCVREPLRENTGNITNHHVARTL